MQRGGLGAEHLEAGQRREQDERVEERRRSGIRGGGHHAQTIHVQWLLLDALNILKARECLESENGRGNASQTRCYCLRG